MPNFVLWNFVFRMEFAFVVLLAKRLAGKNVSEITYLVSIGT